MLPHLCKYQIDIGRCEVACLMLRFCEIADGIRKVGQSLLVQAYRCYILVGAFALDICNQLHFYAYLPLKTR